MGNEFFEGVDDLDRLDQLILPGLHARESGGCVWSYLCEAGEQLNARALDFDSTLVTILDITLELTRADRGSLLLVGEGGQLSVCLARDKGKRSLPEEEFRHSRTIADRVFSDGKPLYVPNLADDASLGKAASVQDLKLTSAMCVPVRVRGREDAKASERRLFGHGGKDQMLGVLYVDSSSLTHPFSEKDLWIFQALANQAATVLQNARLYSSIAMDGTTRLFTRLYFERRLPEITRASALDAAPVAVLMIDVDHLKAVNEKQGHGAGDRVLRAVAQTLKAHLRGSDLPARYGGDEFVVVLPDTDASGAHVLAEKVRAAIHDAQFAHEAGGITASIGIASFPSHGETPQEVVAHADQALFRAREHGGNRCVVWSHGRDERVSRADRLAGVLSGEPARDYRHVSALLDLIEALHSVTTRSEVMGLALARIIEVTHADRGLLFLRRDTGEYVLAAARDRHGNMLGDPGYSQTILRKVIETAQPMTMVDSPDLPANATESVRDLQLAKALCVPMIALGLPVGVVYLDSRTDREAVAAEEASFLQALATQVALALAAL